EQGMTKCKLHGQTQAAGVYKKLGYQISSPEFMEDGIPHVWMTKE
ncbi:GNAT family N-acetyltransferase, partial [Bacillus vallismortis]|nr:GNAT family N-acetyltransferase [Bacillus vallismortis]